MGKNRLGSEKNNIENNIIDKTYNGADYPIIERDYNAYFFPENYDPDSIKAQSRDIEDCFEHKCKVKVWNNVKTK